MWSISITREEPEIRAAVGQKFGDPLVVADRPVPEPRPGQVTVQMIASGLCHTDIHAAHDMVAAPWPGSACGQCRHCRTGWETPCRKQRNSGYPDDGCYTEYYLAGPASASKLPGGPGHLAPQYAKTSGSTVAAIDITDKTLQLAGELGADIMIDTSTEDPADMLQSHGGADAAIRPAAETPRSPPPMPRPGTTARSCSWPPPAEGTLTISVFDTVLNGTSVIGSTARTRPDPADVVALHTPGRAPRSSTRLARQPTSTSPPKKILHGTTRPRIVLQP